MTIVTKRRGRPRRSENPRSANVDAVIAKTIHQMITWGFPLRSRGVKPGVCEVVAIEALRLLGRGDSSGLPIGPDRAEQLFETWFNNQQQSRKNEGLWPMQKPWRYTKETLFEHCPNKIASLHDLAEKLLINEGVWPGAPMQPVGDFVLTTKEHQMYLDQMSKMPKFRKNGVEK